jgi:serpin B
VDFAEDKAGACATINQWVEEKTERRIQDLLQPGMLADPTFLVLVNAIYFKGAWENEFDPNHTRDEAFHASPQRSVQTPFMRQCVRFGYAKLDSLQIVELPYRGGEFSMLVLLPDRIDGLASLEQSLSVNVLATWRSRLKEVEVELVLPKFRITYTAQLRQFLQALGMRDAFVASKADFAGIDGRTDRLFLGGVIHKAFVDVNEEGTEAAAATATVMMGGMPPKPPEFRADHPFLFLIQDNRTGSILFLGRVVDPTRTGE